MAQWRSGAVAQWRSGAVEQWRSGAVAQWRSGAVAQWRSGAVAQWRSGAVAQWSSGAVAQWRSGQNFGFSAKRRLKVRMPAPVIYLFHLILRSYDYNMHGETLASANLCLVTLFSSEQWSQLYRFRLLHVAMIDKTSSFKKRNDGQ